MKTVRHTVAALASACLFTACGGGGSESPAPTSTPSAAVATVQIEGCVTDTRNQPLATRVQAFSDDGRLVANATSNPDGMFKLSVPSRQHLRIGLDAPGSETLPLLTGSSNLALTGCLRESTS